MIQPITSMKEAFDLSGKNALITGGNRGLGKAIALAMAEQGANIAIFCRDLSKARETLEELSQYGGKYESFSCDVADLKNVRKAVAEAYDSFGQFDILVNNAGVSCVSELLDMDQDLTAWYNVLNTDLNGTVHMTYEVGKRMRDAGKGGSIINITSNAGYIVNKTHAMSPYSSSRRRQTTSHAAWLWNWANMISGSMPSLPALQTPICPSLFQRTSLTTLLTKCRPDASASLSRWAPWPYISLLPRRLR